MRQFILSLIGLLLPLALSAQSFKRSDSYNYSRGVEAIQNSNYDEAVDYLGKELAENPKNGYAYSWLAVVRENQEEYGQALTAADKAVRYLPQKDTDYLIFALATRARTYHALEQDDKALDDYARAIKAAPDNEKLYEARGQLYYELEKYDLSDRDYQKMIDLDHGNGMGYMGIGRNANEQKRYDEAIDKYSYVIKLAPNYSSGYSFRAESYYNKGQYDEAINDIIKALSIDGDSKAFQYLQAVADSSFLPVVTRLKIQVNANPNNGLWSYALGAVYERAEKYKPAISYYEKSQKSEAFGGTAARIADCYDELGDYEQAIGYINQAIELDSTKTYYLLSKANYLDNAGRSKEAIALFDKYLTASPSDGFGYYRRGWVKEQSGDRDGAIEDYTMAISLLPDYSYSYFNRGHLYQLQGEEALARADFEKVVAMDTVPDDDNTAEYAYYYLGQKDKAVDFLSRILAKNEKDNSYDAACLYSIMGEKEKALDYLEKSLCYGFRRFAHIARDHDLDNIRNLPEFKALISKYEEIHRKEVATDEGDTDEYEEKVSEVPFTKDGDLFRVKCEINSLPLHFVFDTGASDVSISTVEATFMLKNDYLLPADIIGRRSYMTATGEISEGTVINLRKVGFAGLELNNVKASVVRNKAAPLLLGQSILSKLGKIEIDNDRRVLKVTTRKKK